MKSHGKTATIAAICALVAFVAAPGASIAENKVKTETIIVPPAGTPAAPTGADMTGQVPAPDAPANAETTDRKVGAMPDDRSAPGAHRIPLNAIQDEESATATPDAPDATSDTAAPDNASDEPYVAPEVLYDADLLPPPVRRMREQILDAAASGEVENLRAVLEANELMPTLSFGTVDDPIAFLKSSSGDQNGREILAILSEVLEAGYVHVDVGTPQEMFIWPYFARIPLDKLTPAQEVELFKIVTSQDVADMADFGVYIFYRVGIGPDGTWHYFVAGE